MFSNKSMLNITKTLTFQLDVSFIFDGCAYNSKYII